MLKILISAIPYFPAMVSGLLLTLTFPDPGLDWLAFGALVPFFICLEGKSPAQGFWAGLFLGLCHYLTLIYWIVPTLTTFGGLPKVAALACLGLLSLYLALYPGLFAWLRAKQPGPLWARPILDSLTWVGLEFVRTHALTGFPWGVLGYSQHANLPLIQMADLFGVLGISFVLVACNGALAGLFSLFRKGALKEAVRPAAPLVLWATLFPALALGYGTLRMDQVEDWIQEAPKARIALVQGNIEQENKWSNAYKAKTVEIYGTLSLGAGPADLIIWPETALPFYYGRDPVFSSQVDAFVRQAKTHFLIGSPAAEHDKETVQYFNRAYLLNPLGLVTGVYDKTHLVPFGEYVPFQDLLFFVEKLTSEAGNFSPGTTDPLPLAFSDHATGVLICFEILFPDLSRTFVLNGADLLTTMTNDAWFGRTSAPAQHFSIGVLRAVENRRTLVRAANTGISGFISPTGKVMAATPIFETRTLSSQVPCLAPTSFYTRNGDLLGMAALVAIGLGFVVNIRKPF